MEFINYLIDLFLNLDQHLAELISQYGLLTYLILFVIIFAETGLVFTPFLPGDSLLFAAGALSAITELNVHLLVLILSAAAVLGDTANYWIGHFIGEKLFQKYPRILKKEYLDKTHNFYEKYGGKTIVIARFVPIVRTFAPFVAGVGKMTYSKFLFYNITGGMLWVLLFVYGGYFFGNIPLIKDNFSIVILAIIFISLLPGIIHYFQVKFKKNSAVE
ncbi:MAG: DedA family protein [Ignavibacteriaceae bacterium]|nr:DedA family protein [Ignavibacteriaceae bacterium]